MNEEIWKNMNTSVKFLQDMWFGESLLLHILVESPPDIKQFVMWLTSKTKLLRSKTELHWNRLLDKNLLFFLIYSNPVLLARHICWYVVPLECVYVYRRRERVSFPPGVNTVWNSVCVFSFFPQMFSLAWEIEWLRQSFYCKCH